MRSFRTILAIAVVALAAPMMMSAALLPFSGNSTTDTLPATTTDASPPAGTFDQLFFTFSGSVTDNSGDSSVVVGIGGANTAIFDVLVNGGVVASFFSGCAAGGGSSACGLINTTVGIGPFVNPASLSVRVNYTVSTNDTFTYNGNIELRNSAIPEPATITLFGGALLGLAFFGRKRLRK